MDQSTILELPEDLAQRAKVYAALNGTTLSALVRDHLERLTGYQPTASPPRDALMSFAKGDTSKEAAVAALGLLD